MELHAEVKKTKSKKAKLGIIVCFLMFNIIFAPVSMTLMIRFLPFNNVRETIVNSLITTLSHGYLANIFASENQIQDIKDEYTKGIGHARTETKLVNVKHYSDKNIKLYDLKSTRYSGKLMIVEDPTRITVGYSSNLGTAGETTSSMAARENAVAAINGGAFSENGNWTGTGGKVEGIVFKNGKQIYPKKEISTDISNSRYTNVVGFTDKGVLVVGNLLERSLKKMGLKEAVSFGPAIVVNGKGMINSGVGTISPKTAIGQKKDGAVLMLVLDGRQVGSLGATERDVQNIMLQYGACNASLLDGGKSTTMVYKNRVINNPSDFLGERSVATAFLVK